MHLDESHRLIKAIRNDNSDIIGIKKDLNEEGKSFLAVSNSYVSGQNNGSISAN